ncbi:porin [Burkholderia sp. MR1-5-21]
MKKTVIAAFVCAGAWACPNAQAQSSVTLYGRLDVGFDFANNVQTGTGTTANRWRAESSDWGASYFGFLGKEDLGGGLKAIFDLQSGINLMNGTMNGGAGRLFDRKAFVGLESNRYGRFQLGRDLFLTNYQCDIDPMMCEAFSSASLVRNRNVPITSNNIEYRSPNFGGFEIHGQYAFGNQAGGFNRGAADDFGRSDGVEVTYSNDVVMIKGMYDEMRDQNGRFSNVFVSSREFFVGGNLTIDSLVLQAGYSHLSAPDTPAGLAHTANHVWIGARYRITPALALNGGVFRINVGSGGGDATHDPGGNATLVAAGATYSLSKRTFLYATVAHVNNGSASNFSVFDNNPGRDNNNLTNPMAGKSQIGSYVGIVQHF